MMTGMGEYFSAFLGWESMGKLTGSDRYITLSFEEFLTGEFDPS